MAAAKSADTGQAGAGRGAGRPPDGPLRRTDDRPRGARATDGRAADAVRLPRQGLDGRHRQGQGRRPDRPWKFGGFLAWLLWGGVHIAFLIGFRNRVQVLLSWFWNWLLNARDARLITGDAQLDIHVPRATGFVPDRAGSPPTESTAAGTD